MDFFEACDALTHGAADVGDRSLSWVERLARIELIGLPISVAEYYRKELVPLYEVMRTGNVIRDTLYNVACQCLQYTASPWFGERDGAFVQYGGLGTSAYLASALGNWRVPSTFAVGWLSCDVTEGRQRLTFLLQQVEALKREDRIGNVSITTEGFSTIGDYCERMRPGRIAVLHIAEPPNADVAHEVLRQLGKAVVPEGVILISGERGLMQLLYSALDRDGSELETRLIKTLTIDQEAGEREDALIAIPLRKRPLPYQPLGFSIQQRYTDVRSRVSSTRSVATFPRLTTLRSNAEGVWSAADGSEMRPAMCFGLPDQMLRSSLYSQNYAAFPPGGLAALTRARWTRSFGRVVSFPSGQVIGKVPISADGTLPLECVNPYHVYEKSLEHLWNGAQAALPVTELRGDWIWLPAPGKSLSHWLIENFLPALVLAGMGIAANFICPTPLCAYQKLYMQLAGFATDQLILAEPDRIYHCERLLAPVREDTETIITSFVRIHHPVALDRIESLLIRAGVNNRSSREKLYVSRLDSRNYRACLNEHHVIEHVRKRGYSIVNGGTLTPLEALHVYGNASVICGPLGAGLLNAVFAPRGCQIVMFEAPEYFEEHSEQIAHLVGQDFAYLDAVTLQSDDPREGGARNSNFILNLSRLTTLLDIAEQRSSLL